MKMIKMNKKLIFSVGVVALCITILVLSVRGNIGNPSAEELSSHKWSDGGPFELSPERGYFALLYSFVEDHSLTFSIPLTRFSAPDIAVNADGKYVSLFMSGISFLAIPGYCVGKYLGVSQVGTFLVVSLFALLNVILIKSIIIRLGGGKISAYLSAFIFIFATPAFTYAVSFYQHHISVFMILLSIYLLLRWKNFWSLAVIWFIYALSVVIDNHNLFLMFPVGLYAMGRIINLKKGKKYWSLILKPVLIATFTTTIIPIGFFLWFNQASYGNPFQLSRTLSSVEAINENGIVINLSKKDILAGNSVENVSEKKSVLGFFKTRNLLGGFYIHFFSPDRGVIWFSPVILIGIYGLIFIYRKNKSVGNLLLAVISVNVLLYSMWGDPWGGWAFGSRYLIPTYAILAIGLGLALDQNRKRYWLLAIFFLLFIYSAGVNTLGALTSSANPPEIQTPYLEELSSVEQKYIFMRNWQYLQSTGSKSFVFQSWAHNRMNAEQYYHLVYSLIVIAGAVAIIHIIDMNFIKPKK